MRMTVKDLRAALEGVPDDSAVVFQANEHGGEEDLDSSDEPSFTFAFGYVYSAFDRDGKGKEFVIDGAVTLREG